MSDDEEMTDVSQVVTQSGSILYTSFSLSNNEPPDREPWARIVMYKISKKRYGVRANLANYEKKQVRTLGKNI